jgi:hypothetical protein
MYGHSEVGVYCHWCGEYVRGNAPKTGKHLFCRNNGKCKMAHARAVAAYQKHRRGVTPRSGPRGESPADLQLSGNAKAGRRLATSSVAIATGSRKRSNRRKRR